MHANYFLCGHDLNPTEGKVTLHSFEYVFLTDQGDLQWAPVTSHLAAGSAAASRAVVEQACREKLAGVEEIL
ncbi:MAG: hypothetical protein ABIK62_04310, partial [candidate division WOR-3 bacterium]